MMKSKRISSSCQWYEEDGKYSNFFLNLEKFNGGQKITEPNKVQYDIRNFYKSFCKKGESKLPSPTKDFLGKVLPPKLNNTEINECDNELSEEELYMSLLIMQNNKSPGHD